MCASQCMIIQLVDLLFFVLTAIPIALLLSNAPYPMSLSSSPASSPYETSLFSGLHAPCPSTTSHINGPTPYLVQGFGDAVLIYIQNSVDSRVRLKVLVSSFSHPSLSTNMSTVTSTGDIPNMPVIQNSHNGFRFPCVAGACCVANNRNVALCVRAWLGFPFNLF